MTATNAERRMEWHDRKEAILRRTAQHPFVRLGEGDEAEVYALDQDRIIRFFKRHVDPAYIVKRGAFYAGLGASGVSFAVPSIMEHGTDGEVSYSIERRIPGSSLADLLPRLEGGTRRNTLASYAEAATVIRKIADDGRKGTARSWPSRPFGAITGRRTC